MVWLPKGSRSMLLETTGLKAVYVEQTLRPTVELLARRKDSPKPASDLLQDLQQVYARANPLSAQAFQRACKSLPGGNTRSVLYHDPFPITMSSGRDCHVTSLDGDEYLDLVSEYTAGLFGHSNVQIQQAVMEALGKGFNLGSHNEYEAQLAEALVRRFSSVDMVRFCNSGTEANIMAIALAKVYTKRSRILVFSHGYHGGVLTFEDAANPLNIPHHFTVAKYNDIASTQQVLDNDLAAILVEPLQSAGGMIPASREFLQFLRDAADTTGALLIFDEVVTSRLHINGMQGHHQIYPDLTTLGKSIGGGFSIGAFGGRRRIMERLDPRVPAADERLSHSGTYNNNLFSMTAGIAADRLLSQEKILELNQLGDELRLGIQQMIDLSGTTTIQVTGFGSLVGMHFTGPQARELRAGFYFHMLHHGIYIGNRGFMALNFEHKHKHIEQVLCQVQTFIAAVHSPPLTTLGE